MSGLTYYIVNHTTEEYCNSQYRESIFITLDRLLAKYSNWQKDHDIRIMPENYSSLEACEKLDYYLKYTNLDN